MPTDKCPIGAILFADVRDDSAVSSGSEYRDRGCLRHGRPLPAGGVPQRVTRWVVCRSEIGTRRAAVPRSHVVRIWLLPALARATPSSGRLKGLSTDAPWGSPPCAMGRPGRPMPPGRAGCRPPIRRRRSVCLPRWQRARPRRWDQADLRNLRPAPDEPYRVTLETGVFDCVMTMLPSGPPRR